MKHMILKNGEYACGDFIPEGAVICEDRPSYRHKWIDGGWVFQELTTVEALSNLRSKRNRFLAETDWTGLADSALTSEVSAKWKLFRQRLRDLPSGLNTPAKVKAAKWPAKP
jgi:hypothetical protein